MSVEPSEFPPAHQVVETPEVRAVMERGLIYLRAGFALHLSGPAGAGKTTIAYHLARALGRPFLFAQGDDSLTSAELVRGGVRVSRSRVVDNYIRSVVRTREDMREQWTDGWLAAACRRGLTLIYDEFTRSRPETNNVLLSVLAERVLALSAMQGETIPVHENFRAIFTSNPAEYVGVYRAADALRDRLVTIRLSAPDADAQAAIVHARTGVNPGDCRRIVAAAAAVGRHLGSGGSTGLRAAIALAQVLRAERLPVDFRHPAVAGFCLDLLGEGLDPEALAELLAELSDHLDGEAGADAHP